MRRFKKGVRILFRASVAGRPGQKGPDTFVQRAGRPWVWFFLVLAVLGTSAAVISVMTSLRQQLTPEQLQAARQLWRQHGPPDYQMEYTFKKGENADTFHVLVRGGKVVSLTRNGEPLEQRLYHYYDMPGLYDIIGDFLDQDRQPGRPRVFATAMFDPVDGHLQRYVRSVMSSQERQEIDVQFQALP
jgi:Family of unknown function (DUF6174)